MKSLLQLRHLKIQNANCVAGLTYGFPGVSHFLGFTHALSRKLVIDTGLKLGGCAIAVHSHELQIQDSSGYGDYVFSLTRNPLNEKAKPASFVEEGRMFLDISLLIECDFSMSDLPKDETDPGIVNLAKRKEQFCRQIKSYLASMRVAAGDILDVKVFWEEIKNDSDEREKQFKRLMRSLLPGYFLVQRSDLLQQHYEEQCRDNPEAELLDSWLDFVKVQSECYEKEDEQKIEWVTRPKPATGYLVPIMVGYRRISPLYEGKEVRGVRATDSPYCAAEAVYDLGQWISPHRIEGLEHVFWRYWQKEDWYLCRNNYSSSTIDVEDFN